MSISRVVARPLLAAMFIAGGYDAVRNPGGKVKKAESVALPVAEKVPFLPQDAEKLVQLNGAVMVAAGSLMAIGRFRRLAALALIGSIVPTTYAGHRFWEEDDEATKAQQRTHFLKNIGLLGGLILEVVDTEGAPTRKWRREHRQARKAAATSGPELGKHLSEGMAAVEDIVSQAAKASGPVIEHAREAASKLPDVSREAWDHAQKRAASIDLAKQEAALRDAQRVVRKAMKQGRSKAQPMVRQAVQQSRSKAQPLVSSAASRASDAWAQLH